MKLFAATIISERRTISQSSNAGLLMSEPQADRASQPCFLLCSRGFLGYAALLFAFWLAARVFGVDRAAGSHFTSTFACFGLLLAPYWLLGFGTADRVRGLRFRRWLRVTAPAVLAGPYLLFALPRGVFHIQYAVLFACLPVAMAAVFELAPPPDRLAWQDVVVLLAVGLPVEFGWLRGAWPQPGLGSMPKLLLMDAALYAFLVVRRVPGVGYDFRPRWRDVTVGLREWAGFAPVGIGLGLALRFIRPQGYVPSLGTAAAAWFTTFFFVAIPEELFFRGLLQNLLEKSLARYGEARSRLLALAIAAPLFGLSHFNKPGPFNWRYVVLATLAGVFYGRAWRDRRRLLCSGITHATVDAVWSLWFR